MLADVKEPILKKPYKKQQLALASGTCSSRRPDQLASLSISANSQRSHALTAGVYAGPVRLPLGH